MIKPRNIVRGAVPTTLDAAKDAGLEDTQFDLHEHLTRIHAQLGTSFIGTAKGDIAWTGPCENGHRTVAYYDDAMQPTIYKTIPC